MAAAGLNDLEEVQPQQAAVSLFAALYVSLPGLVLLA